MFVYTPFCIYYFIAVYTFSLISFLLLFFKALISTLYSFCTFVFVVYCVFVFYLRTTVLYFILIL